LREGDSADGESEEEGTAGHIGSPDNSTSRVERRAGGAAPVQP
jgi:hypothetical protein